MLSEQSGLIKSFCRLKPLIQISTSFARIPLGPWPSRSMVIARLFCEAVLRGRFERLFCEAVLRDCFTRPFCENILRILPESSLNPILLVYITSVYSINSSGTIPIVIFIYNYIISNRTITIIYYILLYKSFLLSVIIILIFDILLVLHNTTVIVPFCKLFIFRIFFL
jgi:hypothetical protein